MRFCSVLIAILLGTFLLLKAEEQDKPRMIVHLLDYIAVDYSMAVQNGEIVNWTEFNEMKEFAQTINQLSSQISIGLKSDITLLQNLIAEKAPHYKVASVASGIKQKIIADFSLEIAPKHWPSLKNGRALFRLYCVSCHGANGKGDGVLAAGLDPRPTDFHHPDKADGLSPFQVHNTIRLGVENTGMRAFNELSDDEVWNLAFYVLSLPQDNRVEVEEIKDQLIQEITLENLASLDNNELSQLLSTKDDKIIAALRLHPKELSEKSQEDYLDKAKRLIEASVTSYKEDKKDEARNFAITAYLEGIEPVEAYLKANNSPFVAELELQLSTMRSAIESNASVEKVQTEAKRSMTLIDQAKRIMSERSFNSWLVFLLSFFIILREGLEAFLVIIAVLGIIRALKLPKAANWIHAGWIMAIIFGFLLWLAADRLFTFTGAQRELLEGVVAFFAVGVLLYVGFWMHDKSKAHKWQAYVKRKAQNLARKENLLGLAFLSFLVVFREAFESVLFLSALGFEVQETHHVAFGGGIVSAFAFLIAISVMLLKYSKKISIIKLFQYSALIISCMAIILAGKGIHAFQEAGNMSISIMPLKLHLSFIGLYPTWETFLAQFGILILIVFLWNFKNRQKPLR